MLVGTLFRFTFATRNRVQFSATSAIERLRTTGHNIGSKWVGNTVFHKEENEEKKKKMKK